MKEQSQKSELKENVQTDLDIARGAMREIIDNNRSINRGIVLEFEQADYHLLEEYNLVTDGILKAAKLLTDINAQTPKTLKDINSIEDEKQKINLEDLIEQ